MNNRAVIPRLTKQQAAVLLEALEETIAMNKRHSTSEMVWYHRGEYGFGINRRTAAALEEMGLVHQRVWERFYRPTQYIQLTPLGHQIAGQLANVAVMVAN